MPRVASRLPCAVALGVSLLVVSRPGAAQAARMLPIVVTPTGAKTAFRLVQAGQAAPIFVAVADAEVVQIAADFYNTQVANGKWSHILSYQPRYWAAYQMPTLGRVVPGAGLGVAVGAPRPWWWSRPPYPLHRRNYRAALLRCVRHG
ncbi:MAG: hypothetical protein WKG07_16715 [Hymenobacter sp.]